MSERKEVLKFKDVTFAYEIDEPVLKGIDLTIYKGETVGLLGGNGAGKSTLMKLVTGLLQTTSGSVQVGPHKVTKKNLKAVRKMVGYTFQDPDNQLFMPTVYDDVAFSSRQKGLGESQIEGLVEASLKAVDGLHLKDKAPYKMSGGEKRLVTLATVLVDQPDLLILDEPAVGLDPKARRRLMGLLKERDETIIVATHDMDMALDLCDRVIVLYDGLVKGDDTPIKIFTNKPLLCENHLELPLKMQGCPIQCHLVSDSINRSH